MSNREQNRIPDVIPAKIAESSGNFVELLKKYYEFMNQEGMPSYLINNSLMLRDFRETSEEYLNLLFREFGSSYSINNQANVDNILSNLDKIYAAKGSVDSIKVLFRVLFGEEVEVEFPKELILKPSDGNWLSDYSVMMRVIAGDPNKILGEYVEVETSFPNTPTQRFEVEVKRVERRSEEVYEIFVSRYFSGFFYFDSKIIYEDVEMILTPSLSKVIDIEDGGTGFRVGESFTINDYSRTGGFNDLVNLPQQYTRKEPSQSRLRQFDTQNVDIDVRSDGTITEVIDFDSGEWGPLRRTRVIRGTRETVREEYQDGTVKEYNQTIAGIVSPNLQVNWDAISSAMLELVEFDEPEYPLTFFNFLTSTNPSTGVQYADINGDGEISSSDATLLIRSVVGLSIPSSASDAIQDIIDDWFAATGETVTISIGLAISILRLSAGLSDPDAPALFNLMEWLKQTATGDDYPRGDIDNDGIIDTDDLLAFIKYYDEDGLRAELSTAELNWITTKIINPFNALTGAGQLFDGLTIDDILLAMGIIYSQDNRNQLHDFLLEMDGDYATGHVRADINNDGSVTTEDVTLLLRRASGLDISSEHLTWIDEVIAEPLLGSIYNPLLIDGPGTGAVCRVKEVGENGAITRLAFQSFGFDYPDNFRTFVEPTNPTGTPATLAFSNTIVGVSTPSYVDRKGFLSDIIKVQDNDFYQQFSYVVKTGADFNTFGDSIRKSINPAGMKFFAEQTITDEFNLSVDQEESTSFYFNRLFYELTDHFDDAINHFGKSLNEGVTSQEDSDYSLVKPLSDDYEVSENKDYDFNKPLADGYSALEDSVYSMEKDFVESISTGEELGAFTYLKSLADLASVSDETTLVDKDIYSISKSFVETVTATDSQPIIASSYTFLDSTEEVTDEELNLIRGKGFESEVATTVDLNVSSISKVLFDFTTIVEDPNISLGKVLSDDIASISDSDSVHFNKSVLDSASVSDETSLIDKDIYVLTKGVTDSVSSTESDILSINKPIEDESDANESGNLTYLSPYVEAGYFVDDFDYARDTQQRSF